MNPFRKKMLYCAAIVLCTAAISTAVTITAMNALRGDHVVLSASEYSVLAPLAELAELIEQKHYGESVTREALLHGAMDGMLSATGDPYTRYFTEEEYEAYLERLGGQYHGLGALVSQPDGTEGVTVLRVYAGSAAEQAGLLVGDRIVEADGISLLGLSLEEISTRLGGEAGSTAQLTIMREDRPISLAIPREGGTMRYVQERKLLRENTGYIRIDQFSGNCVEEFREALLELTDRHMRSLVIDLRNNPGGELDKVVAMADLVLGDALIVRVMSKSGAAQEYRSDAKGVSVPIAVLVNAHSASASELFAGAVQQAQAGVVVGMRTFGKGVVQTTQRLESNRAWVKMTTAAYVFADGSGIDGVGVTPDIEIDLSDALRDMPIEQIDQEDDAQLWAALDHVREAAGG